MNRDQLIITLSGKHIALYYCVADHTSIRNLGNTCFLNCIVQLLWSANYFRTVLLNHMVHHNSQGLLFSVFMQTIVGMLPHNGIYLAKCHTMYSG